MKISIITPTFNRAHELPFLIDSIENQNISLKNLELIISDDGSTDNTPKIISDLSKKTSFNIKYITQKNKGPGSARNHGLKHSNGDLILFIDSDCEAHHDWLKNILKVYNNDSFDAFGGPDGSKDDFTLLQKAINFSMTSTITTGGIRGHGAKRYTKFYPRTHNMGITRSTLGLVGEFGSLRHGQDIEYSNRIIKAGLKIEYINNALVFHRRRTSIRQFFKQVFNWGMARVNLAKIDSDMLELIHFLPSLFLLSLFLLTLLFLKIGLSISKIFLIFFLPLLLISCFGSFKNRDFKIMPLLLIIIPTQIFGYGIGFTIGLVRRFVFDKNEVVGFKKNYYK
jgi:glycosyltransferase involved in cell wall biosynthesis